jgi:hypothetical protein
MVTYETYLKFRRLCELSEEADCGPIQWEDMSDEQRMETMAVIERVYGKRAARKDQTQAKFDEYAQWGGW